MAQGYPCIYIDSLEETILEYDWLSLETHPPFFPGMELSIKDMRWAVERVFVDNLTPQKPCIWVLVAPSNKPPFVTDKHLESLEEIYEFQTNRELGDDGDDMFKSYELN